MARLFLPVGTRDHGRGPKDAPVTLVEYGDFECSFCGRAYPVLKKIEDRMGPRLRIVYRHFPLATIHPHAETAALAAEAAGAQGKFWEMHDLLFQNQGALEEEDLLEYAQGLALDLAEFAEVLSTGRFLPRIREDFMSGVRSGVNGTPTLFINGEIHAGSTTFPEVLQALEHATGARSSR